MQVGAEVRETDGIAMAAGIVLLQRSVMLTALSLIMITDFHVLLARASGISTIVFRSNHGAAPSTAKPFLTVSVLSRSKAKFRLAKRSIQYCGDCSLMCP